MEIRNRGSAGAQVTVRNGYRSRARNLSLQPGRATTEQWSLGRTRGWYDLVITVAGDTTFSYRYAGHLENGEASISDPAMGGLL